ncbi:heavy metal-associated isoprenylated plant protein 26 [Phtheirospermum japonicum]|uniref:Heavy metal-associated isoprenylated plant protein 26 n=1 Tax=Phtheirospermum japonicum TaxID=374723 RepID=A0A830D4N3_9LAMI|nr:heavy metal-associated isoprenylated plant protein 26 [Phtheirospermum japonicum]
MEEAKEAAEEGKKEEDVKKEEKNSEEQPPAPPSLPQEIVLRVFMHCEGCARKVRRCLKGFEGVEDVIADCKTSKVVVKGEKAEPLKVLERVQRKSHRKVELISPIPSPPADDKELVVKPDDQKEEPPVITVVLGVYMHCDACAQEIKRRIKRMKGIESSEPDLESSQVKVKGVFKPQKLVDYVYKRTGKHAVIVKIEPEPEPEKREEEKAKEIKEVKEEKNTEKEAKKEEEEVAKENKEGGGEPAAKLEAEVEESKLELRKIEFDHYYPQNYQMYPPTFVQEMNAYPPQIFSDENPNACSVM